MSYDVTFEQCRDALGRIAAFHGRMREHYQRLESIAQRTRVQLLLDHLEGREASLKRSLDRFRAQVPEELLDTWFQYSTADQLPEPFKDMELPADMEIAAVADLAMQFDDWLLGTYRQLAEESEVPELRELFDALIEQQLGEKRQLAKNLNELADI